MDKSTDDKGLEDGERRLGPEQKKIADQTISLAERIFVRVAARCVADDLAVPTTATVSRCFEAASAFQAGAARYLYEVAQPAPKPAPAPAPEPAPAPPASPPQLPPPSTTPSLPGAE